MEARLDIHRLSPEASKVLLAVERYTTASVEPGLLTLLKLRASVVNGCAYCVDMHAREGLAAGQSTQRLFGATAWRESPFFDERERAALALTDAVTSVADGGVPDDVWDEARRHFGDRELGDLLVAIGMINLWNRLAVATHAVAPQAG